jgi:hypothetical protein
VNWSERATWRSTLAVRIFDWFCGRERNFNPAVVVFRGMSAPLVFRFFYAFHEAKQGSPQFLAALEQQLFATLQSSGVGR